MDNFLATTKIILNLFNLYYKPNGYASASWRLRNTFQQGFLARLSYGILISIPLRGAIQIENY